jgi:hypothetical protein
MSRRGEKVEKAITKIAKDIGEDEALSPFRELLDVVREMNLRLQEVEKEVGYSDSFVDPNDANNRITNQRP